MIFIFMFIIILKFRDSVLPEKKNILMVLFMCLISFAPAILLVPSMIYTSETNILILTISFIIFSYFGNALINFYNKRR